MNDNAASKPTVFLSYSHKDEKWKTLLQPHLKMLQQAGRISIWDDRQIDAGGIWFNNIKEAMARSAVAVCLISADYLASDFCTKEEIPYLLQRREKEGMVIVPVLLRPCFWKAFEWIKETQMLPRDGKSIAIDFERNCELIFTEVAASIFNIVNTPGYQPPKPVSVWSPPEKIDINRLPMTGGELFGRQKELEMLDKAWESENTHIISLVAWGGVGKSTLVNKWLERVKTDNFRGAQRVFAWTFHSQGSGEKVTSADLFFSEALTWFGDPDPVTGSPWDKGARLAELIRKKKTLLVLDGLEPLQSPYEYERGKIKDPGMATLLTELARNNNGLCIITTREAVADLLPFRETTCKRDLEQISAEAGRALLRISGVQGTDAELEVVTGKFGNHALALSLLGVYLQDIKGHHISNAAEIPELDILIEKGRHSRRMMAAFEKRFGEGPEVDLLKILGLFDYPAEGGAIAALRAAPSITNLTENITGLSEADWLHLLEALRGKKLIASKSKYEPDTLDAHPLIREHFGEKLRNISPDAWKEAHSKLYEYYKTQAKEYPDTIEEMLPLYRAVAHGCKAGRYQEALEEVYFERIRRREEAFSIKKLGALSADIAVLSGFFIAPWSQLVSGLRDDDKAWVLNEAGFVLRALGLLREAAHPIKGGLNAYIAQEIWAASASAAINLSELLLTIGDIAQALDYAKQSVDFGDRSGDFSRWENRLTLADAQHQAGRIAESEALFKEVEDMEKNWLTEYSGQGFQYYFEKLMTTKLIEYPVLPDFKYWDLLLSMGKYMEVLSLAEQTLDWIKKTNCPHDIALNHLNLGRAHLLRALHEGTDDFSQAAEHLNLAVDWLRRAGVQDKLPRGLLARAELYMAQKDFDKARRNLDEALTIAERGEMGLHKADCRLGYARLFLATGEKEKARGELAIAKEMIGKMGYHRRDGEVKELEGQLQ